MEELKNCKNDFSGFGLLGYWTQKIKVQICVIQLKLKIKN